MKLNRVGAAGTGKSGAMNSAGRKAMVFVVSPGGLKERGGIGRLVSTVTRYWHDSGSGPRYRVVDPYGPAILPIAPLFFAQALIRIVGNAMVGRIAVLHVNMATHGSVVRKAVIIHLGALLKLPIILHLHGGDTKAFYRSLPLIAQRILARSMNRANRIIVLGEGFREFVVREIGIEAQRVVVLPNAVFGPSKLMPRHSDHLCRILFVGKIEPEKGVAELLQAFTDQRVLELDWTAHLIGAGRVEEYRKRAKALGLAGRVEFTGWQSEGAVRRWLTESDIYVLPSHFEGLPMALLEALAYGLAVIATPVGAIEEAVEDGVSGLLVPVRDAEELATALARCISDKHLRARLQSGARRTYLEKFDIAVYCHDLEDLYRAVCENRNPFPVK